VPQNVRLPCNTILVSPNDVHAWNMVGTWHNTRDFGKINNLAKLKSRDLIL
jgi:hypothetical protein